MAYDSEAFVSPILYHFPKFYFFTDMQIADWFLRSCWPRMRIQQVLPVTVKGSDNARISLPCQIDILDTNIVKKKRVYLDYFAILFNYFEPNI